MIEGLGTDHRRVRRITDKVLSYLVFLKMTGLPCERLNCRVYYFRSDRIQSRVRLKSLRWRRIRNAAAQIKANSIKNIQCEWLITRLNRKSGASPSNRAKGASRSEARPSQSPLPTSFP